MSDWKPFNVSDYKIPGIDGEIDTVEEVDALGSYMEKQEIGALKKIALLAFLLIILGAAFLYKQERGLWGTVGWPAGKADSDLVRMSMP